LVAASGARLPSVVVFRLRNMRPDRVNHYLLMTSVCSLRATNHVQCHFRMRGPRPQSAHPAPPSLLGR
jgi:hypothetical protein